MVIVFLVFIILLKQAVENIMYAANNNNDSANFEISRVRAQPISKLRRLSATALRHNRERTIERTVSETYRVETMAAY